MAGIKALFNGVQLNNIFEQFQEKVHSDILNTLRFVGEEFVNKARISGNYKDRTGNLRSSIGYIILKDGKIINKNFEGEKEGKNQGQKVAKEVAEQHPDGYVLIGVAGMQYAAYVEAKSFDVITGSAPEAGYLKSILDEI
ncbi:hypothetical protein PL373_14655 [Tenacibaculum maritimum]|nr:hypothetical protein [Tenacibaculum maritimum]MDB0602359.1 hypothetical protein [Tenacibaculum maritimum]MDB0613480.1 hypothetical protein [Tenacibaculum maritimum]